MEKSPPLLTLGMLVYNEEKHVDEAIKSILNQTYQNFILIISDNASTDQTAEICRRYANQDKRIVFVRQEKNRGGSFNALYLLNKTTTPFFMYCGGHDKWHPQFIEKLLPIIQENKDLVLIYPRTRQVKSDGSLGSIYQDDYTTTEMHDSSQRYLFLLKNLHFSNMFYGIWRTEILKNCDFKHIWGADVNIILQAALFGKFKQYHSVLLFERIVDRERRTYCQHFIATHGYRPKFCSPIVLHLQFIFETIKILYRTDFKLTTISKLKLSIETAKKLIMDLISVVVRKILGKQE